MVCADSSQLSGSGGPTAPVLGDAGVHLPGVALPFPRGTLFPLAGRPLNMAVQPARSLLSPFLACCSHAAHFKPIVLAGRELSSRMQPPPPGDGGPQYSRFIPMGGPPCHTLVRTRDTSSIVLLSILGCHFWSV